MRYRLPTLVALAALITAIAVYMDTSGPLRAVVTTSFLLVGPGLAFVPLLGLTSRSNTFILAVACSLALDLLVATAAVYSGLWSPPLILGILIGLTLIGTLYQVVLGQRVRMQPDELAEQILANVQNEPQAEK